MTWKFIGLWEEVKEADPLLCQLPGKEVRLSQVMAQLELDQQLKHPLYQVKVEAGQVFVSAEKKSIHVID